MRDPTFSLCGLRTNPLFIYGVNEGTLHCEMRSSTEPKYYRIAIRLSDGACYCECPWFEYRCKHGIPTIYEGRVCRHLTTYREFLKQELHNIKTEQISNVHQVR